MTSGIYQLNFNNTAYYVGQSVNIENRWAQHADKFRKSTAAKKMQDAYNTYGAPEKTILIVCHKDYLDMMENYFIDNNKKYAGNLNTSAPALDPGIDYAWMLKHYKLLQHSQFSIIERAVDLTREYKELETEHGLLQKNYNTEALVIKAAEEIKMQRDDNAEYKVLYPAIEADYNATQAELNKINRRGLFKRIFNYD